MAGLVCSEQGVGAGVAPQGAARRVRSEPGEAFKETFTGGRFPEKAQLGEASPGLYFAAQLREGCTPVRSWPVENSAVLRF